MTRNIDQTPQYNPNDNSSTHTGAHPERVPTTTGSTPAYPGFEPAPIDTPPKNLVAEHKKKLIALGAIGGVLVTGAAMFGLKGGGDDKLPTQYSNSGPAIPGQEQDGNSIDFVQVPEITTVAGEVIDPSQITAGSFYNNNFISIEERSKWATDYILNLATPARVDDMNQRRTEQGLHPIEFNRPSPDDSAQEILDWQAGVLYMATLANGHTGTMLIATSIASGSLYFDDTVDIVEDHVGGDVYIDTRTVLAETPIFTETPIKRSKFYPNGNPSKIVQASTPDGNKQMIYMYLGSSWVELRGGNEIAQQGNNKGGQGYTWINDLENYPVS